MKNALDNPEYEPPVRDPKAIRNTVIALVIIMVVGGFLVVRSYLDKQGEEVKEYAKGRPAMSDGNVRTNFQVEGPGKKVYMDGFTFLAGKVTVITTVSLEMEKESKILLGILSKSAENYKGNDKVQFVVLSADPYNKVSADQLKEFCNANGCSGKQWFFLTSKSDQFANYINRSLKLGNINGINPDTKLRSFPDMTKIIDSNLVIRGRATHFRYVGLHEVEMTENKPKLVSEWQALMHKNIDYILENEAIDANFNKKNNSNRYNVPLIVFGGFVLFIIIMGLRVKKLRNKEDKSAKKGAKK